MKCLLFDWLLWIIGRRSTVAIYSSDPHARAAAYILKWAGKIGRNIFAMRYPILILIAKSAIRPIWVFLLIPPSLRIAESPRDTGIWCIITQNIIVYDTASDISIPAPIPTQSRTVWIKIAINAIIATCLVCSWEFSWAWLWCRASWLWEEKHIQPNKSSKKK